MNEMDCDRQLGGIFGRWRTEAGLTQKQMAEKVGCSQRTIASLENGDGTSHAKFYTAFNWARITGHEVESVAQELRGIKLDNEENRMLQDIRNKFGTFSADMIRATHFITCCKHGSNLHAFLHLSAMYAQLPIKYKQIVTQLVKELYEMSEAHGEIACPDDFRPDSRIVEMAQQLGKQSAFNRENKYTLEESDYSENE